MDEFLAAVLARTACLLIEALITRLFRAFVTAAASPHLAGA
jgi:hypothetical protein